MRIERLIIRNYRQFRQADIRFPKRRDTDLHYIIGTNGAGKTNILNSLNWCLYGDEPHLSKDSKQLSPLNLKTLDKLDVGKEAEISVQVWAETEEGISISFVRRAKFQKLENGIVERQGETFEVRHLDEKGNTELIQDDEANLWVERFVPKNLREFFFFDGERLDRYFKEATGQNIKHAVFQISQIDLLENFIEHKLQGFVNDFRKEAGKVNPNIEAARKNLEYLTGLLIDFRNRARECENQIKVAREKISEFDEKLRGVPDIINLEEERSKNNLTISNTKELLSNKQNEKKSYLIDAGTLIMLMPAIKKTIGIIHEKKEKKEIPPPIEKLVYEEVIKTGICAICGKKIDSESRILIENALSGLNTPSEIALQLMQMEIPLQQLRENEDYFHGKLDNYSNDLTGYEKILSDLSLRNSEIDKLMSGYNEDLIREWYTERSKYESIRDDNQISLGGLQQEIKSKEAQIEEARKLLDLELGNEIKVKELTRKLNFCQKALSIAQSTREKIMEETRQKIENETRRQFFALVWKKETFGNLQIKEDYSIDLYHSMGYECLGSISAGEREMLALAFTLALHKTSGFDSPILIDTPVARISDLNRTNFGNVLCEVSTTKQTVLLFTPDEFSENIKGILSVRASGKYILKLTQDESEAKVEEI